MPENVCRSYEIQIAKLQLDNNLAEKQFLIPNFNNTNQFLIPNS